MHGTTFFCEDRSWEVSGARISSVVSPLPLLGCALLGVGQKLEATRTSVIFLPMGVSQKSGHTRVCVCVCVCSSCSPFLFHPRKGYPQIYTPGCRPMAMGQNLWLYFRVGAPPILGPILVGIGMFTGGTGF